MKKRKKSIFYIFCYYYYFLWEAFFSAWQKDSRCRTCQHSHVAVLFRFRSVSLNLMKCKLIWNSQPCFWWLKPLTKLRNKIYPRYIFTLTLTKMTFPSPPHPTPPLLKRQSPSTFVQTLRKLCHHNLQSNTCFQNGTRLNKK